MTIALEYAGRLRAGILPKTALVVSYSIGVSLLPASLAWRAWCVGIELAMKENTSHSLSETLAPYCGAPEFLVAAMCLIGICAGWVALRGGPRFARWSMAAIACNVGGLAAVAINYFWMIRVQV